MVLPIGREIATHNAANSAVSTARDADVRNTANHLLQTLVMTDFRGQGPGVCKRSYNTPLGTTKHGDPAMMVHVKHRVPSKALACHKFLHVGR